MELKLNVDINKLEREAVAKLHSELTRSINNMVYGMIDEAVRSRQTDQYGRTLRSEGYIRTLIRERMDDYVTSADFENHIQQAIQTHAKEAATLAVRKMLESASRRRVFEAVPHKENKT